MRVGEVLGQITLSQWDEAVTGGRFLVTRPLDADAIRGRAAPRDDVVVVYDELGAAPGMRIAFTEGREGAMPFMPKRVPTDAYNGAILDTVTIEGVEAQ